MNDDPHPDIDLQEAINRNHVARQIITGFLTASDSEIWRYVHTALADVPALSEEIYRLRAEIEVIRLHRANLAAAALATLRARQDAENDPLAYVRDELAAQGYDTGACA